MNRGFLLIASFVALLGVALAHAAAAAAAPKRFHSDIEGVDLLVTCQRGPIAADYATQTASGVPSSDPYAVSHDADKGLVALVSRGGRRVKRYIIPRQSIRAIVAMKYDMDAPDRADLIFTPRRLIFVHTSTANAGIFTISDVYELPVGGSEEVDSKALKGDPQLLRLLDLGLSSYRPAKGECTLD